jgi:TPP-dependent pyruvate/acetoin dehydrogenase alpha subunit
VPKEKSTAIANNSDRSASYGIPGVLVPDNDPVAIYEAAGEAVARARRGSPSLIEVKTDRLLGHFEGDPQLYRTKEQIEELRERDAIKRYEKNLTASGVMTEQDVSDVWTACRAEVDEAIEFARTSAYPAPEAALEHVFA